MSTATANSVGVFGESAMCPQCMSTIPQEMILVHQGKDENLRPRQTVQVYCSHCNLGQLMVRTLSSHGWQRVGPVTPIEGGRRLRSLRQRLGKAMGIIQMEDDEVHRTADMEHAIRFEHQVEVEYPE